MQEIEVVYKELSRFSPFKSWPDRRTRQVLDAFSLSVGWVEVQRSFENVGAFRLVAGKDETVKIEFSPEIYYVDKFRIFDIGRETRLNRDWTGDIVLEVSVSDSRRLAYAFFVNTETMHAVDLKFPLKKN